MWLFEAQTACHSDKGLLSILSSGDKDEGHKGSRGIGRVLDENALNGERQKSLLLKNQHCQRGHKSLDRPYRSHSGVCDPGG